MNLYRKDKLIEGENEMGKQLKKNSIFSNIISIDTV